MRALVQVLAGLVLVAAALIDLAWTTVAAGSGAGPLTGRIARRSWRLALAVHRRRPSHHLLVFAGVGIVFVVLATWITLVLAGWTLVFISTDGAVRATATGAAADAVSRFYFAGFTVFTLGIGDFRPGAGIWQVATVLATGSGLVLVSLAIAYLVPVVAAATQRRQLAAYISSLGSSPEQILTAAWNGASFGMLSQHLAALTGLLHGAGERHHTYPVLHYFHSVRVESAAAPALVNLSQALDLLHHGVAPDVRPDPATLGPLDKAMGAFLATLASSYITPGDEPIPPPSLVALRAAGVPTVEDTEYTASVVSTEPRRRLLAALLDDDGWPR